MQRKQLVKKIKETDYWDVVIIGGGATGLGTALEAATRGYKTLLIEQLDFTIGTSSRSTKLVHGGVRYLAQGNISLVLEALKERGLLMKNAPHLVKNKSFIIPAYKWWSIFYYTTGLILYDLLSGFRSIGRTWPYSKDKTISKIPTINTNKLKGSISYHDGQFDDARLGINLVQTIHEHNGIAINYIKAESFVKQEGNIVGLNIKDTETNEEIIIKSKNIINATGVFVNDIIRKDNIKAKNVVKPSQGVHIVLNKKFLPKDDALMIPKTKDGRVLFAVPWHNKVIIGTTDVPKEKPSIEPKVTEKEVDFILETAQRYLSIKPTRKDIKSVFAGLRPLAIPKKGKDGKTKEISRKHKVLVSKSGLVSIIGGKWTTFREMGEDAIDRLIKLKKLPLKKSVSETVKIHGFQEKTDFNNPLYFYGSDLKYLDSLIKENQELDEYLSKDLGIKKVQIVWAVRNEFARNVSDILARRTRALFLDAKESVRIAPEVANIIAKELNYDDNWIKNQIELFTNLAKNYMM